MGLAYQDLIDEPVGMGHRGTVVTVGKGGFRYSVKIGPADSETFLQQTPPPRKSHKSALLDELNEKYKKLNVATLSAFLGFVLSLPLAAIMIDKGQTTHPFLALPIACLFSLPWALWFDRNRTLTRVAYAFDEEGRQFHRSICSFGQMLEQSQNLWFIGEGTAIADQKRNAGANEGYQRVSATLGWGKPPRFKTNIGFPSLKSSWFQIYFLPDRILIYQNNQIRGIDYEEIHQQIKVTHFVEIEQVPKDAYCSGQTWKYVNKNGTPDRRFNDNHQIPIMDYGLLSVQDRYGYFLQLQISRHGLVNEAAKKLATVQNNLAVLDGPHTIPRLVWDNPQFWDDPLPFMRLFNAIGRFLSFRWVRQLSDLSQAITWIAIFGVPLGLTVALFIKGVNPYTLLAVSITGIIALCGLLSMFVPKPDTNN